MAIQKQAVNINFSQGVETKTDPFQVPLGKMLSLENTVFDVGGLLKKRNGYQELTRLPDATSTFVTTFNQNLLAISDNLAAYSQASMKWIDKGPIQPLKLDTMPLIRSNTNQTQVDAAIASNGLICTVYTESTPSTIYRYAIADSVTGQNIVAPTTIVPTSGTITGAPRVFLLGKYFVIVFTNASSGNKLAYIAINTLNPTIVTATVSISSLYTPAASLSFDGVVSGEFLYLAWAGSANDIHMKRINMALAQSSVKTFATQTATAMSVCVDETIPSAPVIYASYYDTVSQDGYTLAVDYALNTILSPTQIINNEDVANITCVAQNDVCTIFYEVNNAYSYDSAIASNYIKIQTITKAGVAGTAASLIRSVGLASKAFILNDEKYFLAAYDSVYQPSYFLVRSNGKVISKLAYSNGGGYLSTGLPNYSISGDSVKIPYLIKDLVQGVNKAQGAANPAGVYSQTGLNLATFTLDGEVVTSSEIGSNLNIPGGFLWAYDGYSITENGFFVWPDNVETTPSATGGFMASQVYYYVATYEWTDNQGNNFRSAPSIPVIADLTSYSPGVVGSVVINVPTLRLTYKINNPVKLVLYRWSTAQQTYYQVTSITSPTLNNPAVDSIAITDTLADASILGNNILYTTGGVLENIAPPAADTIALFQSRLFLVDSEDKNLLWYSKQVIESTPVEMSDLLTIYVAPTTAAQGSTGGITALSALDDKLILFKQNAIYYITGTGPDNTGANSQFSEPIFITATVGSVNQKSIVFMPSGLMFQSDKGIWLLDRNLQTTYLGSSVEGYTQDAVVQSSVNVPGTNQVRFTLSSGITLMYDYYYGQWGTFTKVPAISSTLYEGLHTYIDSFGRTFQESPGRYLDGSNPVLIGFTTSWINLAGLQGYERAYFFYLLGTFITPHMLTISIAYDYNISPTQVTKIIPYNYNPPWGGQQLWGSSPSWGGNPSLEQWRVFLKQQKCQSFQISIQESFDAQYGTTAGAGLTLSGLDLVVGVKSGYPRLRAAKSAG